MTWRIQQHEFQGLHRVKAQNRRNQKSEEPKVGRLKGFILNGCMEWAKADPRKPFSWPGLSAALRMCGHKPPLLRKESQRCDSCVVQEAPSWETSIRWLPLPASPAWPTEANMGRTQPQLGHQCSHLSSPPHITKYAKEQASTRKRACKKHKQQGYSSRISDIKMIRYRNIGRML